MVLIVCLSFVLARLVGGGLCRHSLLELFPRLSVEADVVGVGACREVGDPGGGLSGVGGGHVVGESGAVLRGNAVDGDHRWCPPLAGTARRLIVGRELCGGHGGQVGRDDCGGTGVVGGEPVGASAGGLNAARVVLVLVVGGTGGGTGPARQQGGDRVHTYIMPGMPCRVNPRPANTLPPIRGRTCVRGWCVVRVVGRSGPGQGAGRRRAAGRARQPSFEHVFDKGNLTRRGPGAARIRTSVRGARRELPGARAEPGGQARGRTYVRGETARIASGSKGCSARVHPARTT
jgi:hypothetical protein